MPPGLWVQADFNGLFGDVLCLSHKDTCRDANGEQVPVEEGMSVTAFSDELLATGTIGKPPRGLRHTGSQWVLRIDERGVRYEESETWR